MIISSLLELEDVEHGTELLDNSAAKHKMAVRPQRKRRSESRHRDSVDVNPPAVTESISQETVAVVSKKIKSSEESSGQQTYRRTRSGRHSAVDPAAKRE